MRVKLVAIDVDGTLLNDQYEITDRTKKALAEMRESGAKIVLATGRGPGSCYPIMDELRLEDHIITHNGAVVLDARTKEISFEIGFQASDLLPLITYCRQEKIHFDVNTALELYIEGVTSEAEWMYEKFFMTPNKVSSASSLENQIVKFTLFGDEEKMDKTFSEIHPRFPQLSIIRSGEQFIDVIHPNATKGNALKKLTEWYGIEAQEVVAFGNYFNDLEMLQFAGLGVAMQNSPEEVKRLADRVSVSNNEHGVAVVLEEILAEKIKY
ncbi:Cof-type HAD-IIB family hydrolase [Caldalkalibacillus mannanilyticus]|uniref:Cof-type HAD-IIB family hydrolase n=1 Tax=Caldalkalibacillus mannanilyticus TaxID=1418 RepID=UPI0004693ED9|nr:Cof-type HAD-IIB family hydrolase [Caldalkalibacillus mannanilyticus]